MADELKRGYLRPRFLEGYDPAIDRMSDRIDELEAEIGRLRATGDALAEALDWNLSCPCNDEPLHGLDAEMNTRSLTAQRAWQEARRG